jgi:hypothetical protein
MYNLNSFISATGPWESTKLTQISHFDIVVLSILLFYRQETGEKS